MRLCAHHLLYGRHDILTRYPGKQPRYGIPRRALKRAFPEGGNGSDHDQTRRAQTNRFPDGSADTVCLPVPGVRRHSGDSCGILCLDFLCPIHRGGMRSRSLWNACL